MIVSVIYMIIKVLVMVVLLVAMVMVLLGIKHLSNPQGSATLEETDALKREVNEEHPGLSRHNLFRQFLYSDHK